MLPAALGDGSERGHRALRLQEHLQERPRLGRVAEALCPEKLIAIMEHTINLCILFSDDINKYCKYFLDEEQYHSGYKRAVKRTHIVYDSSCRNFTASEYISVKFSSTNSSWINFLVPALNWNWASRQHTSA